MSDDGRQSAGRFAPPAHHRPLPLSFLPCTTTPHLLSRHRPLLATRHRWGLPPLAAPPAWPGQACPPAAAPRSTHTHTHALHSSLATVPPPQCRGMNAPACLPAAAPCSTRTSTHGTAPHRCPTQRQARPCLQASLKIHGRSLKAQHICTHASLRACSCTQHSTSTRIHTRVYAKALTPILARGHDPTIMFKCPPPPRVCTPHLVRHLLVEGPYLL